jgi:hypothetical protein
LKVLADEPRIDIRWAARAKRDNNLDGPARIVIGGSRLQGGGRQQNRSNAELPDELQHTILPEIVTFAKGAPLAGANIIAAGPQSSRHEGHGPL